MWIFTMLLRNVAQNVEGRVFSRGCILGHWLQTCFHWTNQTYFDRGLKFAPEVAPIGVHSVISDYCGVTPKCTFFFSLAMSQFNWPITNKKLKLQRLPKIKGFNFEVWSSSLVAHLYTWKDSICWSICDKSVVLLGMFWGAHWELGEDIGNLMKIYWEHVGT